MDDKSLPHGGLPVQADPQGADDSAAADRRAFIRRAVAVGIPVVLATVRGRTVYARQVSGCGSIDPSGCDSALIGGGTDPTGVVVEEDISKPKKPKKH